MLLLKQALSANVPKQWVRAAANKKKMMKPMNNENKCRPAPWRAAAASSKKR